MKSISELSNPEDVKLLTLAKNTLARSQSEQAAALRDNTGRTYVAINVATVGLTLDALQAVLTVALASGITGIESVLVTGVQPAQVDVIKDFAPAATIFYCNASSEIYEL
jgi:cytidine deaminase